MDISVLIATILTLISSILSSNATIAQKQAVLDAANQVAKIAQENSSSTYVSTTTLTTNVPVNTQPNPVIIQFNSIPTNNPLPISSPIVNAENTGTISPIKPDTCTIQGVYQESKGMHFTWTYNGEATTTPGTLWVSNGNSGAKIMYWVEKGDSLNSRAGYLVSDVYKAKIGNATCLTFLDRKETTIPLTTGYTTTSTIPQNLENMQF